MDKLFNTHHHHHHHNNNHRYNKRRNFKQSGKKYQAKMADVSKPTVVDNHDGTICVKYDPKQEGNYEMQIKYNNMPIKGSPYKFIVDNTPKGLVTAFGA